MNLMCDFYLCSMVAKTVRTIFLALGLAMIWLGFFYSYELKKMQASGAAGGSAEPLVEFETYTLENNQYEGEFSPKVEFSLMNETDSSYLLMQEEPAVNSYNTAGFAKEFDLMEQERTLSLFPVILTFAGAVFLVFGFFSCKIKEK